VSYSRIGRGAATTVGLALLITTAPTAAQSGEPAGSPETPVSIDFVAGQIGITFYTGVECGARAAAKDFNVDPFGYNGSHNWDPNESRSVIEAFQANTPQGWVLAPTDADAFVSFVTDEMAAGRPVVTVDAPMNEPAELANMQSDHYGGGVLAAQEMIRLTGGTGTYFILQLQPGLPDIGGRAQGFRDTILAAGGKLLEDGFPGTDTAAANSQVAAAIAGTPDLAGVYATHESAALGASAALKDAGQQGTIKLIAFDAAPSQVNDLRNGVYDALIAQQPYAMGYNSVKLVAETIRKGVIDTSAVEHDQPTGFAVITRENVDDPPIAAFIYPADLSACPTGAPAS
jgi:ribose transport system substrate-binding protein